MAKVASISIFKADTTQYNRKVSEAKSMLQDFGVKGKQAGQIIGQFDKIIGTSIGTLGKLSVATAAVSGALKVAKDAFFASEENIDTWQSTVYSASSAYESFLTHLNTGDISGYLSNIDQIVSAAQTAYAELDRLSTQKAINNASYQKQMSENERMRTMLRTGRYIAPADGRAASMPNGTKLSKEQLQKIATMLENGMKNITKIIKDEISQTDSAIEALYTQQARELGMTQAQFKAGTASMEEFDKRMKGYANYNEFERKQRFAISKSAGGLNLSQEEKRILNQKNPYQQYKAWGVFKDDGKQFNKINELINQRASLQSGLYGQYGSIYKAVNKVEGSSGSTDSSSSKVGNVSVAPEIQDNEFAKLNESLYKWGQEWGKQVGEGMAAALKTTKKPIETIEQTANKALADIDKQVKESMDTFKLGGTEAGQGWEDAANAISSVGAALTTIEDPTVKVAGLVAQAIANIALTFSKSLQGTVSPWDWIAGAAAGGATMIATIASIKQATAGSYANGGIIPGADTGGRDSTYAYVAPGEIILNKSQQRNLASQLGGLGSYSGGNSSISGEQIVTVVNAYGRRTGRGEILK